MILVSEVVREDVRASSVGARFKVSERIYTGRRQDLNSSDFDYEWATQNSCRDLPQGENIPASYEVLNQNNEVLQGKTLLVSIIDTCRG